MAFPMFSPIQRQESFKLTRKIAKTPTSKSLTLSVKWPHPKSYKANPSTLADAGFYWNPNLAAKDNVTCFFCEENFSDWEVHHDPHVIHYDRCGESCAWATAQCGIFAVDSDSNLKFKMGNDPDRLPCGKFLENKRYTIFLHGDWPHDKTKGHTVTSRKMAGAGFLFTPHDPGDDTAKCFYCGIELSGWDPDDDPVEEHRRRITKRGTECPFFTARITELPDKKKSVRKTTSKASLQPQKPTRTRSTKAPDPEPDSDDQEENLDLGRSTRSRAAKATRTPARNAPAAKSRATPSITETDEPSGSDVADVPKPKVKASKRKAKDEAPIVEVEGDSEAATDPPRKSTRAKKTKGAFEDIEIDVNFEESKPRQAQPRRMTRSRSKAPAEDSDSDGSVKSVRSTRSTRSTKSTKGTATKPKKKAKTQTTTEEEGGEEMVTPVRTLKKSTRSIAPKSTKGRKLAREESLESESSGLISTPPPPPKVHASTGKSHRKIIESESEEWESAQEDVAPTPRPSTTKKARGRPPKATKTPKAVSKPPPSFPSPTPTSNTSRISGSYMSESELQLPVRDSAPKAKKSATRATVRPFHEKPSNRNRALGESGAQPLTSSRHLSVGSKENAGDRDAIVVDSSDDGEDTMGFIAPPKNIASSSNPPGMNGGSTNVTPKPKPIIPRTSFIGVVVEPSPRMKRLSAGVRGKMGERFEVDMDVDEAMALDQPSRSAQTDRDSPVTVDKGKGRATGVQTKPKPVSNAKQKTPIESEASDSVMDVDDGDDYETQDVQSIRDSRQPSTPRRDPPRKLFRDDSNPFTAASAQEDSTDATNPFLAIEALSGRGAAVIYALAEEEKEMTVEEWTKRELEIQVEMFKEHGLRKIREVKERAAEVRRQIEAL